MTPPKKWQPQAFANDISIREKAESSFTKLCKELEHWETDSWVPPAVLDKLVLTNNVLDPCAGTGVWANALSVAGYNVRSNDIKQWRGFKPDTIADFLSLRHSPFQGEDFSCVMNPPFTRACEFVEHSFKLGARLVLVFQAFDWWNSNERKGFWVTYKPTAVYSCGDRATCWRHDIPQHERKFSTPTNHAVFAFQRGHAGGTQLGHLYKNRGDE